MCQVNGGEGGSVINESEPSCIAMREDIYPSAIFFLTDLTDYLISMLPDLFAVFLLFFADREGHLKRLLPQNFGVVNTFKTI